MVNRNQLYSRQDITRAINLKTHTFQYLLSSKLITHRTVSKLFTLDDAIYIYLCELIVDLNGYKNTILPSMLEQHTHYGDNLTIKSFARITIFSNGVIKKLSFDNDLSQSIRKQLVDNVVFVSYQPIDDVWIMTINFNLNKLRIEFLELIEVSNIKGKNQKIYDLTKT